MTAKNRRDPMRRSWKLHEWPERDQVSWAAAIQKGYILDGEGPAAHWANRTKETNIQHYGRWIGWHGWCVTLDHDADPADRVFGSR